MGYEDAEGPIWFPSCLDLPTDREDFQRQRIMRILREFKYEDEEAYIPLEEVARQLSCQRSDIAMTIQNMVEFGTIFQIEDSVKLVEW